MNIQKHIQIKEETSRSNHYKYGHACYDSIQQSEAMSDVKLCLPCWESPPSFSTLWNQTNKGQRVSVLKKEKAHKKHLKKGMECFV